MLTDIFTSNHRLVAGVELFYLTPDTYSCSLVIIGLEKKKLVVKHSVIKLDRINQLKQHIQPNVPVYVSLNGKVVLSRKMNHAKGNIETLFPGLNKDDFYTENIEDGFVAMARKKLVDECVHQFELQGFKIAGLSLGPFAMGPLFPLLQINKGIQPVINCGDTQVSFTGDEISNIEYVVSVIGEEDYRLGDGDDRLSSSIIIAYATALGPFVRHRFPLNEQLKQLQTNAAYWTYKLFLRKTGALFLSVLLAVLIVNTVFYFNLYTRHSEIQKRFRANEFLLKKIDTLEKQLAQKEQFLSSNGLDADRNRLAWCADGIASTLPQNVRLITMSIGVPSVDRDKDQAIYSYDRRQIRISGVCNRETELNTWINAIKQLPFTIDVQIHQVSKDISNETVFEIEVQLK